MKQKLIALGGKFDIYDEEENPVYQVEGSFLKIPKSYQVKRDGVVITTIRKKVVSLFPTFYIESDGEVIATIKKRLSFIKAKYDIEAHGITVKGSVLDMDFQVFKDGELVGEINQQWLKLTSTYAIHIYDPKMEGFMISICVAIDNAKESEDRATDLI
jgi:uncharacterized protein YxjI